MRVGVNWTSPHNADLIKRLVDTGEVDFCELLIDNFLIYEPEVLLEALPTKACAFHIMNSHFLHRELGELKDYAKRIRVFAKVLNPIYVSDHVGVFAHNGKQLPFMMEVVYDNFSSVFSQKVKQWAELLECTVFYENFPSYEIQRPTQVEFFRRIQGDLSPCLNILFDVSNAILAEKNGCEALLLWHDIAEKTPHLHLGSYRKAGKTSYYLDSHDRAVPQEGLIFLQTIDLSQKTIVVERDYNLNFEAWSQDIGRVRHLLQRNSSDIYAEINTRRSA
ncbi:DUF692 family protein [bacterium NHP-B]|nr:DUF692 family protein [bacterium NHP-B]